MEKVIIVTGGIGSGKSTITKMFAEHGLPTIDADEIVTSIYNEPEHIVCKRVVEMFGSSIVADGKISKALLRTQLQSQTDYEILDHFFANAVTDRLHAFADEHYDNDFIVWEVPLAIEKGITSHYADLLVSVVAPKVERIERVIKRSGLSQAAIEARIVRQVTLEDTIQDSDYLILNNRDHDKLVERFNDTYRSILLNHGNKKA